VLAIGVAGRERVTHDSTPFVGPPAWQRGVGAYLVRRGRRLDRTTQEMVRQLGEYVCENWARPDEGIWEARDTPQLHTHSHLLCWVAVDRLLELHHRHALKGVNEPELVAVRGRIRAQIETRGWNARAGTYTQLLDGDTVDASLLLMGWYGFHAPDDLRLRLTYQCIRERLGAGAGLLYRHEQSRAAGEGAFGICSFWAAEYLALGGGSLHEAQSCFEDLLHFGNDLGLYAEEIEPATGAHLGNFPQAYTHVGLIGAALALDARVKRDARRPDATRRAPGDDGRAVGEVQP
jgi:GH15 family glucan-1,4-alpha-glucosidase